MPPRAQQQLAGRIQGSSRDLGRTIPACWCGLASEHFGAAARTEDVRTACNGVGVRGCFLPPVRVEPQETLGLGQAPGAGSSPWIKASSLSVGQQERGKAVP